MKDLSPPDHVGPLVGHDASYGGGGTSVLTEPFPPYPEAPIGDVEIHPNFRLRKWGKHSTE